MVLILFQSFTLYSNTFLKHLSTANSLPDKVFGQNDMWETFLHDEKTDASFRACHFKRNPYLRIHKNK